MPEVPSHVIYAASYYDLTKAESDPCIAGTPGCCINHAHPDGVSRSCEAY